MFSPNDLTQKTSPMCLSPTTSHPLLYSEIGSTFASCLDTRVLGLDFPVALAPETRSRFRLLTTSVFNDSGLGIPCNLIKSPQALHTGKPSWVFRHREVLFVEQFEQDISSRVSLPVFETRDNLRVGCGFGSLDGKVVMGMELKLCVGSHSSDGEVGADGELEENMS